MSDKVMFLLNKVAVEKSDKFAKKEKPADALYYDTPPMSDSHGIVRHIGTGVEKVEFKVGDRVYYGPQRENLRIAGADLMVMDVDNIYAVVRDDEETTETSKVSHEEKETTPTS